MSQFENVTVIKKANVYFDGQVTSRTILFADGSKKTLGIMNPGETQLQKPNIRSYLLREKSHNSL